jgi:asparagine synthase (glutamine-hydrolysing)
MCGIAGKLYRDSTRAVEPEVLERMGAVLAHRGPDDAGCFRQGSVGLVHRRLSIIDLSPAGHQPMANEDESCWIVFNGEIYNFQALREDLVRRGHRFRSGTDTEVVLHLYEEQGDGCVEALRGMFAFAIWDARRRQLLLARDRLGKKPLAYQWDGEAFRFASEVKAIFQDPALTPRPDAAALSRYLTFGYVPGPDSAFQGIRHLPPAHVLLWRDGRAELRRYWRLRRAPRRGRPEAAWCEELLARLEEAVRIRLVSEVPLGAFLSGGIDSSAVVAMMCRAAGRVQTFSIGFGEAEYDELRYARLVAERFGTAHHELRVRPDAAAILPALAWHYDEPFADSSAVPTYYVARLTRRHVTVALNGDGGDESFGGYERYAALRLAAALDRYAGGAAARGALRAGLALWPRRGRRGGLLARSRRFLEGAAEEPGRRYGRWMAQFLGAEKTRLCTPEFLAAAGGAGDDLDPILAAFREDGAADPVDAAMAADVALYLPDDLLVKADIASMANSLEARSPFLDHPLMEFAATLPADLEVRGRATKLLLKRALRDLLPAPVLERPKRGFGVPIDHWLRGEMRALVRETLLSAQAVGRGYLRRDAVERLLDEHGRGAANWHPQLWTLLMLELWHRTHVDGDGKLLTGRRLASP